MAKKGGTYHTKRLAAPKAIPLSDRKASRFMMSSEAGAHPKEKAIPLGVLLRDVLKITRSAAETRKTLNSKQVLVDGKARRNERLAVGLMDMVSFPSAGKTYRIIVNRKAQLVPSEIKKDGNKLGKVVGKRTVKKGKINITLHDGRNMEADNNVAVGDTVIISVPEQKLGKVLKFEEGAKCLVTDGKHAGTVAKLEAVIRREGEWPEARLKNEVEFITLAKYLFVIDESYEGA